MQSYKFGFQINLINKFWFFFLLLCRGILLYIAIAIALLMWLQIRDYLLLLFRNRYAREIAWKIVHVQYAVRK